MLHRTKQSPLEDMETRGGRGDGLARLKTLLLFEPAVRVDCGFIPLGAGEVGAPKVGVREVGTGEVGIPQVGACEVGALEVDALEVGTFKVGALEAGTCEFVALKVGAGSDCVFIRFRAVESSRHSRLLSRNGAADRSVTNTDTNCLMCFTFSYE